MPKLTGMEWLKRHIAKLEITTSKFVSQINIIKKIEPKVYNKFQPWTPLKLVLLNYALDTCTTIIRTKAFFKNKYYVDLFAGSGLNKIKKTNDFLIGSPLIATLNYSQEYSGLFFCENNLKLHNALKKRLKTLNQNNIKITSKSCIDCLNGIINQVNKPNTYSFFFIDPYFIEFNWEAMKKVLNITKDGIIGRDVLFTFMSGEIIRYIGWIKKEKHNGKRLTDFFGDDAWKSITSIDGLVNLYKNKIMNEVPETIIRTVKIKSAKHGFCYHLFFIVKKTKGLNPWIRSIDKAKKEIESNSDKSVEMALNIIKKRQSQIFNFTK